MRAGKPASRHLGHRFGAAAGSLEGHPGAILPDVAYKVIDIFKDLPRTNCGDCGKASCFAFASAAYLEAFPLKRCPHLEPDLLDRMQRRLDEGRGRGEGRRPASSEQALRSRLGSLRLADLRALAERAGGVYEAVDAGATGRTSAAVAGADAQGRPGLQEGVRLTFLGEPYVATRDDVVALTGLQPSHWIKIVILIYLTRASGRSEMGEWVAYRSLPNTVSKSRSFDACADRIAAGFAGDLDRLERVVSALGGAPEERGSADRAYRIRVLPRVSVLLLLWDQQEEFPARVSLLLDRVVLDYLDQEALVFMAEALVARLLGEDVSQVVG